MLLMINLCLRFMEGHAKVLTDHGITSIATNNSEWKDNASVYCSIAENEAGELVGGIRLHLTNGIDPLPAEKAVGEQDPKLAEMIYSYSLGTTGEVCGLWNSRKGAGYGLSILLVRTIVAIATQVNIVSMFALCASHTVYFIKPMGFRLEESIGDNGVLLYPVINHPSPFFRNPDIINLSLAEDPDLSRILDLRQRPTQETIEVITKPVEIHYNLQIPNSKVFEKPPLINIFAPS